MFWRRAGLSSRPVYPESVGIALASDLSVEAWFCGEINSADQKRLGTALPAGSGGPLRFRRSLAKPSLKAFASMDGVASCPL